MSSYQRCFRDAFWDCMHKHRITQTEYVLEVVSHFAGVRHSVSYFDQFLICPEALFDPFSTAVRKITVEANERPCKNFKLYENMFLACFNNQLDDVARLLKDIRNMDDGPDPIQPLIVLAVLQGHAKIVQFCLDSGAVVDRRLAHALKRTWSVNSEELDIVLKPYEIEIREASQQEFGPDGRPTPRQIEESFGDINW